MLVELRRIDEWESLFPDLYDNLYKALNEVCGNCIVRICKL